MRKSFLLLAVPVLLVAGCSSKPSGTSAAPATSAPASSPGASGSPGAGSPGTGSGNTGAGGTESPGSGGTGTGSGGKGSPGTGSGGSGSGGSGSGGTGTGGKGSGGTPRCHTADLTLTMGGGDGAAGTQYALLRFTNTSSHVCTLAGYPGVSWVAGDKGAQVNEPFTRSKGSSVKITLEPGDSGHATLASGHPESYDAAKCRPVDVRGYRVYPPDETASIFVSSPQRDCSAKGVNAGRVLPIEAGASL